MKFLIPLILGSLLTGCVATMVNHPGGVSSSPYAPVNEKSRGGVIKYLNQGADVVIKERREDAYKQMYKACDGKYKLDAEGEKSDGGYVVKISDSSASWADTSYWYIQFSCMPDALDA
ncbi:MAG: hypothetical protein EOP06_02385 [Proteobacteria bacterium]|nr:MAG: hypothetical protein EOP06_02385 [Pseudomonadota bacterium]